MTTGNATGEAQDDVIDRIDCFTLHQVIKERISHRFQGEDFFYFTHPRAWVSREQVRYALNEQCLRGREVTSAVNFCITTFFLIPRCDGTFTLWEPGTWHHEPIRRFLQAKKDASAISEKDAAPIEHALHYGWSCA